MKDIQLNNANDLQFVNGDLAIAESEMQEVSLILESNQGEWKEWPVLGPNLMQLIKTNQSKFALKKRVKIHLSLDGKDYADIEKRMKTYIKTN